MTDPIAYTIKTAAAATGLSEKTIERAIRSGDLVATRPTVDGRKIAKDSIAPAELKRWVTGETVAAS